MAEHQCISPYIADWERLLGNSNNGHIESLRHTHTRSDWVEEHKTRDDWPLVRTFMRLVAQEAHRRGLD